MEPIKLIMPPTLEPKPLVSTFMSHSTVLSMLCVIEDTTLLFTVRWLARWFAVILSCLKPSLAQTSKLRIAYVELEAPPQLQQVPWFCIYLVFAHLLSGARIRTYSSTFLGSNSTTKVTLTFDPSCHSSLPGALTSLIIFSTAFFMLITSSPLMRPCQS